MAKDLAAPLSDDELDELEQFLLSESVSDETMLLDMLDGFLTAIVIGPTTILPSRWLPRVWGSQEDDEPHFETEEQAQRILELIMRHMNGIVWTLQSDPGFFDPLLSTMMYEDDPREYVDGEMWAHGFMDGVELCRQDWEPLFDDATAKEAIRPIRLLGAEVVSKPEERLVRTPAQREKLSEQIAGAVSAIYRFWLPLRKEQHARLVASTFRREEPKTGRNDPCPCGSGKKFKRCCGATPTMH